MKKKNLFGSGQRAFESSQVAESQKVFWSLQKTLKPLSRGPGFFHVCLQVSVGAPLTCIRGEPVGLREPEIEPVPGVEVGDGGEQLLEVLAEQWHSVLDTLLIVLFIFR